MIFPNRHKALPLSGYCKTTPMTREDFIQFIETLRADLLAHPDKLANKTLYDYLEAVADIQGYYDNTGKTINADKPD